MDCASKFWGASKFWDDPLFPPKTLRLWGCACTSHGGHARWIRVMLMMDLRCLENLGVPGFLVFLRNPACWSPLQLDQTMTGNPLQTLNSNGQTSWTDPMSQGTIAQFIVQWWTIGHLSIEPHWQGGHSTSHENNQLNQLQIESDRNPPNWSSADSSIATATISVNLP